MTAADRGKSSQRRGKYWQNQRCIPWLRTFAWPHAATDAKIRKGDVINVGDRIIECTVEPWGSIARKLGQAKADAAREGYDEWSVWRPARNHGPGEGYAVFEAGVIYPLLARLDRLEHAELVASDAWERGFTAGVDYQKNQQMEAAG